MRLRNISSSSLFTAILISCLCFINKCVCQKDENEQIGLIVRPNNYERVKVDLTYEIDKYRDTLQYLKKDDQIKAYKDNFYTILNNYFNSNFCLKYFVSDYIVGEGEGLGDDNEELITSIDLSVLNSELLSSVDQELNINIIDNEGNLLRSKRDLLEDKFQILLSLNVNKIDSFYICFENNFKSLQLNKKIEDKDDDNKNSFFIDLLVKFGIPTILKSYEETGMKLDYQYSSIFTKIEDTMDLIIDEIDNRLIINESKLRNINEGNFENITKIGVLLIVSLIVFNLIQVGWLFNYLKKKKLI